MPAGRGGREGREENEGERRAPQGARTAPGSRVGTSGLSAERRIENQPPREADSWNSCEKGMREKFFAGRDGNEKWRRRRRAVFRIGLCRK